MGIKWNPSRRILQVADEVHPGTSAKAGGVDKQPNSCNLCHYHKNDPADKLQLVMDRMEEEYYK